MALALVAIAAFLLPPARADAARPTKDELAATTKWFDGLGWPDLGGKPYVEITMPRELDRNSASPDSAEAEMSGEVLKWRGFLLAEDDKGWTIFVDGIGMEANPVGSFVWPFSVNRIEKARSYLRWPEKQAVLHVIGLPQGVKDALALLRRNSPEGPWVVPARSKVSVAVASFGLARWCARIGRKDLAARLDAAVSKLAVAGSFRADVEEQVGHDLFWRALSEFGHQGRELPEPITRPEGIAIALAAFVRVATDFAHCSDRAEADRIASRLREMATEDTANAELDHTTLVWQQPPEVQLRHWLYELRNHEYFTGQHHWFPHGWPNAVDELVRLGGAAVPALIDLLGDQRLTRTVLGPGRDTSPETIVTVGDCAVDALSQIAGLDFGFRLQAVPMISPEGAVERRQAIEEWWRDYQTHGERATLIRNVRAAGYYAFEKAHRLAGIDPAAAVDAISAGLAVPLDTKPLPGCSTISDQHEARLQLLGVLESIKSGEATTALRREMREDPALNLRIMAAEEVFQRGGRDAITAMIHELHAMKQVPLDDFDWTGVTRFLGSCGDFSAMQVLAEKVAGSSPPMRAAIAAGAVQWNSEAPEAEEVQALGEKLAVEALEDRSMVNWGVLGEWDCRVCDIAAKALSDRWPRYFFYEDSMKLERDPQIAVFRNRWREAHKLPPRPVPERVVQRDPNTVVDCRWIDLAPVADFPVKIGQPLTRQTFVAALRKLLGTIDRKSRAVAVSVERLGDRGGFVVEVQLNPPGDWGPGMAPRFEDDRSCLVDLRVESNGENLRFVSDAVSRDGQKFFLGPKAAEAIDAAFKVDAGTKLGIYFQSTVEQ